MDDSTLFLLLYSLFGTGPGFSITEPEVPSSLELPAAPSPALPVPITDLQVSSSQELSSGIAVVLAFSFNF
ncbi:MAG: hypothetical protein RB296_03015 [Acidobacteriota bacterium]|nr:hypothetical protein [Acidobacteriota bacterium]